ncbi:phage virion morphogenesis protein [Salinisphaera sp. USBA-960]|nr:phage virion morphogenesis protein [Salifodinibacter halophilus]NNC25306.1 phage virion morphogenesis protein [Salifodinibacter halophilus]
MASDDLQALEDWVQPILDRLAPAQRRHLTRKVAQDLRRRQRERIKSQRNPDGTPFKPRKSRHRTQSGARQRKAMFNKIRTARYLKAKGDGHTATVGFTGRVARIARTHEYGQTAKVEKNGPRHDYPTRVLIGFAPTDVEAIRADVIRHLDHIDG